jgi:hypothetical protein
MNRIVYAILALAALTSCANSYNIQGTSNVSMLDGRMLYLKVYQQDNMKNVDSCDVVHGQFHFTGTVDTTRMAILFMDDESIMPMVIEGGDITIRLDNMQQKVSGTPLNDKLTQFNDDYNKLQSRLNDLGHKQTQAIMNGDDEMETNRKLAAEADEIAQEEDKLVTSFITENFDNVLGPGVFFMITAGYQYPMLQPWIEDLWSKATDYFKNDAYVKSFYEKARQNEAIMNGTAEAPLPQPSTLPQAPTPNEMAAPADSLR